MPRTAFQDRREGTKKGIGSVTGKTTKEKNKPASRMGVANEEGRQASILPLQSRSHRTPDPSSGRANYSTRGWGEALEGKGTRAIKGHLNQLCRKRLGVNKGEGELWIALGMGSEAGGDLNPKRFEKAGLNRVPGNNAKQGSMKDSYQLEKKKVGRGL